MQVDGLDALIMEPADIDGVRGAGFTSLRRELGWLQGDPHPLEEPLTRAISAELLHLDDPDRLRATAAASPTGQRYIHHEARGSRVLLFVREHRREGG